jgi:hypothetical protein
MRTTITIAPDLLKKAKKLSKKDGYSDAIVTSLRDYVALKERLSYLHSLFRQKAPHSFRQIKKMRRKGRWSSQ